MQGQKIPLRPLKAFFFPLIGIACVVGLWTLLSQTVAPDLPSPLRSWEESKRYVLDPFFKEGEMNQGIGRLAYYSLVRVAKGYALALLLGTPIGFLLGLSRSFTQAFDPLIQILRPISPLAWLPLGLILFQRSEPAALFTIAICAMWPVVRFSLPVLPCARPDPSAPSCFRITGCYPG